MDNTKLNFEEILIEVQKTKQPAKTYPYFATEYLGYSRRGWRVVEAVNRLLEKHDVICEPEFGRAWFYGQIEIKPKPKVASGKPDRENEDFDPIPRLSLLKAYRSVLP